MRWLAILILLCTSANAQMMTGLDGKHTGGAVFVGAGDVIGSAQSYWGLRAYTAAYATGLGKLALICTPADAVCANVNSDANGNFNLAGTGSLTCNNSGSICTVKTLFDQTSGTFCTGSVPCDITNATIANRPILVVPGAANGCTTTSNFCMQFAATQTLTASTPTGTNQPFTISMVALNNAVAQDNTFFDGANIIAGFRSGANTAFLFDGSTIQTATASDGAYHTIQYIYAQGAGAANVYVDATSTTLTIANNGLGASRILGQGTTVGFVVEIGIWPIAFSVPSQVTSMKSNQHTYWGF